MHKENTITITEDKWVKRHARFPAIVRRLKKSVEQRGIRSFEYNPANNELTQLPQERAATNQGYRFFDAVGNMVSTLDTLVQLYERGKREFDAEFVEKINLYARDVKNYLTAVLTCERFAQTELFGKNPELNASLVTLRKMTDERYSSLGYPSPLAAYADKAQTISKSRGLLLPAPSKMSLRDIGDRCRQQVKEMRAKYHIHPLSSFSDLVDNGLANLAQYDSMITNNSKTEADLASTYFSRVTDINAYLSLIQRYPEYAAREMNGDVFNGECAFPQMREVDTDQAVTLGYSRSSQAYITGSKLVLETMFDVN